jgi:hypothetical protein
MLSQSASITEETSTWIGTSSASTRHCGRRLRLGARRSLSRFRRDVGGLAVLAWKEVARQKSLPARLLALHHTPATVLNQRQQPRSFERVFSCDFKRVLQREVLRTERHTRLAENECTAPTLRAVRLAESSNRLAPFQEQLRRDAVKSERHRNEALHQLRGFRWSTTANWTA